MILHNAECHVCFFVRAFHDFFDKKDCSPTYGTIGRGTANNAVSLPNAPTGSIDDVSTIQAYLKQLVASGTINPTKNSYFPIHFSPSVTSISQGGYYSCTDWCAYHGTVNVGTSSNPIMVVYGVIPDQSQGSCYYNCGWTWNVFQNTCYLGSHELVEAITDPYIGLVTYLSQASGVLGWYDPYYNVGEIGDACESSSSSQVWRTDANGNQWSVARAWSNRYGKCYAGSTSTTPTSPPPPTPPPTSLPTAPTSPPTPPPTKQPTPPPTPQPTVPPQPTSMPTTRKPTLTNSPSLRPTKQPTVLPTKLPTKLPTIAPSRKPSTSAPTGKCQNWSGKLTWYGGPVLNKVNITPIMWGSNVADATNIGLFYQGIANSSYIDWLGECKCYKKKEVK